MTPRSAASNPLPPSAPKPAPKRPGWLAHPALSVLLALSWLALSHSLELFHLLSAALLGLIVPRLLHGFLHGLQSSPVNWLAAMDLCRVVLWDIVMSNIAVAKLVLGPLDRMKPAWMAVPLDSDHPHVNGLLAAIITTTPGTVSCTINEERGEILVHALHCDDAPAMVADMKARYEQPLMRMFAVPPREQLPPAALPANATKAGANANAGAGAGAKVAPTTPTPRGGQA